MRISSPSQRGRHPVLVECRSLHSGIRVVIKVLRGMILLYRIEGVVLGVVSVGALLEVLIDLLRVLVDVNGYGALLGMLLSLLLCIL
jgi:sensor histidine kinase regulating citrate/malate metabolism